MYRDAQSGRCQSRANHSPDFFVDESVPVGGVRALAMVMVNYLAAEEND